MFRAFDENDPQLAKFEQQASELRELLRNNERFSSLPEKLTKTRVRAHGRACAQLRRREKNQ